MQQLTRAFKTSGWNQPPVTKSKYHWNVKGGCQMFWKVSTSRVFAHAEASLICFMQQASSVEGEAGWEMWLLSRPFLFFPFLFYCFHAILFICLLSSGSASFSFLSSFPHPYCVLHWLTSRSPGSRQTFSLDLPLSLSIRLFFFSPKRWLAAGASISISSSWHRGTNRQG